MFVYLSKKERNIARFYNGITIIQRKISGLYLLVQRKHDHYKSTVDKYVYILFLFCSLQCEKCFG